MPEWTGIFNQHNNPYAEQTLNPGYLQKISSSTQPGFKLTNPVLK